MKITYKFADGIVNQVDVDTQWIETMEELNRKSHTNRRKYTMRHANVDLDNEDNHDLHNADTLEREIFREKTLAQKISEAVEKLPPKQKDLVRRVFFEGMTESQIASMEGVSQSAISQRLATAKKKLKKLF